MTLEYLRAMATALMCAGLDFNNVSLLEATRSLGIEPLASAVLAPSYKRYPKMRFGDRMVMVAQDLIMASPALRREWLGR